MTILSRTALLTLLVAGAAACGADDAEPEVEAASEVAPAPAAPAAAPAALTDPQIAHVAVTANTIDVETGRLAESRSQNAEVRAFAQTMITDHTAVNEQAAALAQRLGVTPEENEVSRSLKSGAEAARTQLEPLQGEAFDRAYIDREVGYHQAVLDALDQTLIPATTNEELRALLTQVRPAIAAHLDHARMLQTSLAGAQ